MSRIRIFLADEHGGTALEYGMIGVGLSIVIITAVRSIGSKLNTQWMGPLSNAFS